MSAISIAIPPELTLPTGTLLEGIVTTMGEKDAPHISAMGPIVDQQFRRLRLRPYKTTNTYRNLQRHGEGIFHVTDDVELLARAAIGKLNPLPKLLHTSSVNGVVVADVCRWYAFRVDKLDESGERIEILATVVDAGRFRDFFGFNRAKHAVVEASILATRLSFLPADQVLADFDRYAQIVQKTAGEQERRAFRLLRKFVQNRLAHTSPSMESLKS